MDIGHTVGLFFLFVALWAPLVGAIITFGASCYRASQSRFWLYIPCGAISVSVVAYLASWVYYSAGTTWVSEPWQWVHFPGVECSWGIYYDSLTAVMMAVVLSVSLCVHLYAVGYMKSDENKITFMSYLNLFTFAMLLLIVSPNMLQLFTGWEGVGLASYLLIGFWHHKPQACVAAQKAFVVNRVADVGFMIGICITWHMCGNLEWSTIWQQLPKEAAVDSCWGLMAIAFLVAAMGKSAQFGLHVWLPDAMEGPTPVSALIHAATMVTAGIFLIVRLSALYESIIAVRDALLWVGLLTAFFACTVALVQSDIKRIIAYSTCSQLGFMMMACGCGAYTTAIFHLVTHAYFKALLFLGAGAVIHALSDEQDITEMGGLWHHIPFTYGVMWIGSLALVGAPLFSGFYSKEAVVDALYQAAPYPWILWAAYACIGLTALYTGRLLFVVFHGGGCRAHERVVAHLHEVTGGMRWVLVALAVGAAFSGWIGQRLFMEEAWGFQWGQHVVHNVGNSLTVPSWAHYTPTAVALLLLAFSFFVYGRRALQKQEVMRLSASITGYAYRFLSQRWWVDRMYATYIVRPYERLAHKSAYTDETIDKWGPGGATHLIRIVGSAIQYMHTGWLYHYVEWLTVGFIALLIGLYRC